MQIFLTVLSLRRYMPLILLLALGLPASSMAAAADPQPGTTLNNTLTPTLHVDPAESCAKVEPDREYFIPEAFADQVIASGSGRYAYETPCPFWVVDFSMNSKSNTYVQDGVRIKEKTQFYGIPNDLPSTESPAPELSPMTLEDCKRYQLEYFVYTKFKHEANFVLKQKSIITHKMAGNSCYIPKPAKFVTKAPDANVLVIRVATRMKLRTSYQEAAARANDAPPE